MRKADEVKNKLTIGKAYRPSLELDYGTTKAVEVMPKMRTYECMRFDPPPLDGISAIIEWLDKDFYAITDGSPVTIAGQTIQWVGDPDKKPATHERMVLVIRNPKRNSLVAVMPGQWIMRDDVLGYRVFETEIFRKLYDFGDDLVVDSK